MIEKKISQRRITKWNQNVLPRTKNNRLFKVIINEIHKNVALAFHIKYVLCLKICLCVYFVLINKKIVNKLSEFYMYTNLFNFYKWFYNALFFLSINAYTKNVGLNSLSKEVQSLSPYNEILTDLKKKF